MNLEQKNTTFPVIFDNRLSGIFLKIMTKIKIRIFKSI